MLDLGEQEQRLGDDGLDRRAVAEIGRNRLREPRLVRGDRRAQPLQPVQTLIERRGRFRPRALEHGMEGVIQGAPPRAFQRLVHDFLFAFPSGALSWSCLARSSLAWSSLGVFLAFAVLTFWSKAWAFAVILARGVGRAVLGSVRRHKIEKSGLLTLSKADRRWYIPPRTRRASVPGSPSQEALWDGTIGAPKRVGKPRFVTGSCKARNDLSRGGAAR